MNSDDQFGGRLGGLGYLIDNRYLLHDTGAHHPESPERLAAIQQILDELRAGRSWERVQARMASPAELELIHHPVHVQRVKEAARRAPTYLDLDTPVSAQSYTTALLAAGGVFECMDALFTGKLRRVFAFIRPPGHHAGFESARGFCLFNNVALAAVYARTKYKADRIAIADFDVHHGDGTQSSFYNSPNVLYISTHQYPFYPGTGDFDETGEGDGKGYTLNFPLPEGADDSCFVPIYSKIVGLVLDQYKPQLILVSAGFDGHYKDPLGGLSLTQAGYASAAASLILSAERCCAGKICFVLEGGYSVDALKDCCRGVMAEMEKPHPVELSVRESALFREISQKAARFSRWKW
jgi:acetoin utilization deacetylase AcuC-like enzyme